jgi:hypothetical protein
MPSHQINESNSIEANDDLNVQKRNDNIVFVLIYSFNKVLCETSYVIGFFLTIMKNNLKQNVSIECLNHILVFFSFVNYD